MNRHTKVASIAFTGAATTLAVGVVTTQARAASSWHIKNAGVGYHGPVKGHNTAGTKALLKDTTTGVQLSCTTAKLNGSVPVSHVPAVASASVAKFTSATFSHCLLGGTIAFTGKITKTAELHAVSYNASTGVTKGFLGTKGVSTAISGTLTGVGNNCHATLIGSTVPGSGHNAGHSIVLNPTHVVTLKVKTAASCGLLHTNDKAWVSGKAIASTPAALTISKS